MNSVVVSSGADDAAAAAAISVAMIGRPASRVTLEHDGTVALFRFVLHQLHHRSGSACKIMNGEKRTGNDITTRVPARPTDHRLKKIESF